MHPKKHIKVTKYLQKHGSLIRRKVGGQNIPEPDDDSVTPVKATIVHRVLPENNPDSMLKGTCEHRQAG